MCVPKNCAVFDLYLMTRKISLHLWKIHTLESKKSHGVGVFPLVDHLQVTWLRNLGQLEVSHVVASLVHLNVQGFCGSLTRFPRGASSDAEPGKAVPVQMEHPSIGGQGHWTRA